jgi:choline dehydrogenase-like flavoprotein
MSQEKVDVLIIGSGHSGGMAANILTAKGISCLMLNAGPVVDFDKDRSLKAAYELPYRGFKKPGQLPHVFQSDEFNANIWVDENEVPTPSIRNTRTTGCGCGCSGADHCFGRGSHFV